MALNFSGGNFKAPSTTTSAASTGFNFSSSTSSAGGGFTFSSPMGSQTTAGLAGGGFSFPKPSTSSTGFSFSTPASSTPVAAAAAAAPAAPVTTTAAGGFNFNFAPPASSTAPVPAQAPAQAPATGFSLSTTSASGPPSFSFPAKTLGGAATPGATTLQGASSIAATTSSAALTSLFATPSSQIQTSALQPQPSLLGQPATKAPAPATGLPVVSSSEGLFSAVTSATTPASTSVMGATATATSTALVSAPATTTPLATLTTATSTSASTAASSAPIVTPTLSVHGLEDKVNKWLGEITEQQERLMRQAAHVNAWDQLLQLGHDQVQQLRDTLNKVKMNQQSLEAELDFIQGQQQELEQLIEPLEATLASTTPAQHQGDRQRDNMHHLAQNLDAQLHQMTDDLCKVIEHLNSNNSGSQAADPVNTVARVLSAHMDTLKWVDQNSALLTQKIEDLSKHADSKWRI